MIATIREFFSERIESGSRGTAGADGALLLATAALLIEISQADYNVSAVERQIITAALRDTFGIDAQATAELVQLAEKQAQQATCLYEFTSLVDKGFSREQKLRIVEYLWQVAYADRRLEKHEQHLMRRLSNLLHLSHDEYIAAKFRARDGAQITDNG